MPKPWDREMKRLFRKAPRDIVQWLFPGAEFHGVVSTELDAEPIFADHLFNISQDGKHFLLHLEFQSSHDPDMARRLWKYNVRATIQYELAVWSCVIYLKKCSTLQEPFLIVKLPGGRSIHQFDFSMIRLWEVPTRELKEKGLAGLFPLLVLTQEGARREVIEDVITGLPPSEEASKADLLALTFGLASLAFDNEEDQQWLIRRFAMLDDILMETPAFQHIRKMALEEGLKEGLEKGREEGRLEGLREVALRVVQVRFHDRRLQQLAKFRASQVDDPTVLEDLITKIALSQSVEEAHNILIDVSDADDEQLE